LVVGSTANHQTSEDNRFSSHPPSLPFPDKVTLKIILYASMTGSNVDRHCLAQIVLVCKHFRALATAHMDDSVTWTTVYLDWPIERIRFYMARAGSFSLHLRSRWMHSVPDAQVLKVMNRAESLDAHFTPGQHHGLMRLLKTAQPSLLRFLRLNSYSLDIEIPFASDFMNAAMCRHLTRLDLFDIYILSFPLMPSLEFVKLYHICCPAPQVVQLFRQSPHLKAIVIIDRTVDIGGSGLPLVDRLSALASCALPKLQYLEMEAQLSIIVPFLRILPDPTDHFLVAARRDSPRLEGPHAYLTSRMMQF
jgi:hypothetical protein